MTALRALDAAARHGSYSAAAQELGVTHGAISHRIRDLEAHYGATLFRRAGRVMVPSAEALTLLGPVREALAILAQAFPPRGQGGPAVRVAVHPALATKWLIPRLGDFIAQAPDIDLHLVSTTDPGDALSPTVQLAIRFGTGSWPGLEAQPLGEERCIAVCAPGYRTALGLETPADLPRARLLRHGWMMWGRWLEAAGVEMAEPDHGPLFSDSAMLVEGAVAGQGVALVGERFAAVDMAAGRLVQPFAVSVRHDYGWYLTWRAGSVPSADARRLKDWLVTQFSGGALPGRQ